MALLFSLKTGTVALEAPTNLKVEYLDAYGNARRLRARISESSPLIKGGIVSPIEDPNCSY